MTDEENEQLAWQAMQTSSYVTALPLLNALAERNSEFALLNLGWIYETGALGAPDEAAARSLYEQAAQLGSAEAYGRLGLLLLGPHQEGLAEAAFKQGAELGDETSQSMLEKLTDRNQELLAWKAIEAGDYEEAKSLMKPLAARGSSYASLTLGSLHERGRLGAPDKFIARSYYERAAKQGSAEAHRYLGQLLLDHGEEKQARAAFERGAEAGNISCMNWLGEMLLDGRGGAVEVSRGAEWLEAAAAQGHILAKRRLLGIKQREAGSNLRKLLIHWRIVVLLKEFIKVYLNDRDSDKLY
jgi:TPR repeat protein